MTTTRFTNKGNETLEKEKGVSCCSGPLRMFVLLHFYNSSHFYDTLKQASDTPLLPFALEMGSNGQKWAHFVVKGENL